MIHIITNEPFPNGMAATNRIYLYAKGLVKNDVDCKVVVTHRTERLDAKQINFIAKGFYEGIEYEYVSGTVLRSDYFFIRRLNDIYDFILILKYCIQNTKSKDIILNYNNNRFQSFLIILISFIKNVMVIRELCEYPYGSSNDSFINNLFRKVELYFLFPLYSGFIAISEELYLVANRYGNSESKNIKIPILLEKYNDNKISHRNKRPYIFHGGTMYEKKDAIISTIKAFANASKELDYSVDFILAGPKGPHQKEIDDIIHNHNLANNIFFIGIISRKDIAKYLNGASLAILNKNDNIQNKYGFSTKLGEILLSETPVITTSVGEANNYLENDISAYIVKPNRIGLITNKIIQAFNNTEQRKKIAKNGKIIAESEFNYIKQGLKLKNYFSEISNK